jgi:predicted nucleic acid-binding protein
MMLIDTNVLLDVLFDRRPWADDATRLLDRVAAGDAKGFIAGTTVTTVHYLVERARGRVSAATAVSDLLQFLDVVPLESSDFQRALGLGMKDYEDAVQTAAALKVNADLLVSRNQRDYRGAPVVAVSAGEALARLTAAL